VLKSGSKAFASGFSLFSWVFFSATYMGLGFDNFIMGIKGYFFFPFEVLNRISPNNFNQLYQGLNANWIIMIGIVVMTIAFYIIGYNIGKSIGESKIKELESLVANK